MQAILFADRHGHELSPLCDDRCPALLSVANKPVLQHTLEDMALAGIRDILLVISDDAEQLQARFADGALWGVSIRYLLSRGEESPAQLLMRHRALLRPPFLVARGDVLRTASCASFISLATSVTGSYIQACRDGWPIGLGLVRDWTGELPALAWPPIKQAADNANHLDVPDAIFAPLDSLVDFHQAALMLTACSSPDQGPPGKDQEPGLRVGRLSRVAAYNRTNGSVVIGRNTWLHPSARLTGPCLIGDDCYLDRGARLQDSVVMPGSYIGENLSVRNAIVSGDTLIRVDRGIVVKISEPKLLSSTSTNIGGIVRQWTERVAAALLLLLSLPLWPLALLLSILTSPRAVLCRYPVRAVTAWCFATRIPLLRHLPLLWPVIRGDLRLFGARLHATPDDGQHHMANGGRLHQMPTGLLGPHDLFLTEHAPEEEIYLNELAFTADQRAASVFTRLLQAARLLFSRRAWWPGATSLPGC